MAFKVENSDIPASQTAPGLLCPGQTVVRPHWHHFHPQISKGRLERVNTNRSEHIEDVYGGQTQVEIMT